MVTNASPCCGHSIDTELGIYQVTAMQVKLIKAFHFEAAHQNHLGGEKQRRLHGHSYRVDILVRGNVDSPCGWLLDFAEIKAAFAPFREMLDHAFLNELPGMGNAQLSDVRQWVLERLCGVLPGTVDVQVGIVGDCAFVPLRLGTDIPLALPERIRFSFEAAQELPQLPDGHPCRRLHGHSYRVEVGGTDLAMLEPLLLGLYETLDHRHLNEIEGLEHATSERLCEWIWKWLVNKGVTPTVVVVQETETARCVYYGE